MAIEFFKEHPTYGVLSNFSPHGFELDGTFWPTNEHYFQAMKFPGDPKLQEKIRTAPTPAIAKRLGKSKGLRPDWNEVRDSVMERGIRAKFTQNEEVRAVLLSTGDEQLIERSAWDAYWGSGRNGRGKNKLGLMLMSVRASLRAEQGACVDALP